MAAVKSTNPKDIAANKRVPLALIPPVSTVAVAKVLEHGAEKYGPFNWRETPVGTMTYLSAMQRHLSAFIDGEEFDPDSGMPHLAHIAAGAAILLDAKACGTLLNDRPVCGPGGKYIKAISNGHNPFSDSRETVEAVVCDCPRPPAWDGGSL